MDNKYGQFAIWGINIHILHFRIRKKQFNQSETYRMTQQCLGKLVQFFFLQPHVAVLG